METGAIALLGLLIISGLGIAVKITKVMHQVSSGGRERRYKPDCDGTVQCILSCENHMLVHQMGTTVNMNNPYNDCQALLLSLIFGGEAAIPQHSRVGCTAVLLCHILDSLDYDCIFSFGIMCNFISQSIVH